MKHVVALSGGKDSTAMALRLREVEPKDYIYVCNPTGDELPEMLDHWKRLEEILKSPIVNVTNKTLDFWIDHFQALPNWRQRWCTRLLKIEPTIAFLKANAPAILYVGLRADEEIRPGIYSDEVTNNFPLRRWKWGIDEVRSYLKQREIKIPVRTDCARCYGQRLSEWKELLRKHPDVYESAAYQERKYGHTFRSSGRDSWPASLADLKEEFRRAGTQGKLFDDDEAELTGGCRVCRI